MFSIKETSSQELDRWFVKKKYDIDILWEKFTYSHCVKQNNPEEDARISLLKMIFLDIFFDRKSLPKSFIDIFFNEDSIHSESSVKLERVLWKSMMLHGSVSTGWDMRWDHVLHSWVWLYISPEDWKYHYYMVGSDDEPIGGIELNRRWNIS